MEKQSPPTEFESSLQKAAAEANLARKGRLIFFAFLGLACFAVLFVKNIDTSNSGAQEQQTNWARMRAVAWAATQYKADHQTYPSALDKDFSEQITDISQQLSPWAKQEPVTNWLNIRPAQTVGQATKITETGFRSRISYCFQKTQQNTTSYFILGKNSHGKIVRGESELPLVITPDSDRYWTGQITIEKQGESSK
jgi:hypothetical protein